MSVLRDYQQKLIDGIFASWNAGNRNVAVVLPTGGGKTVTMSHLIRTVNVPSAAIAHRQELVSQISLAMAGAGIVHRIVAPDVMVRFIVGQHVKRFGRSFYHANAPVAVAGIDTLLRRAEALLQWRSSVQLWDIDECFAAGTMIDTAFGAIAIEKVRVGDEVLAFNESTGDFESRRVMTVMCNAAPHTMFDILINGEHILCTAGHPFWTKRGWVEAKDLTTDDVLFHMQSVRRSVSKREGTSELPVQQDRERLLHENVRDDVSRCSTRSTGEKDTDLRGLRDTALHSSEDMRAGVPGDHIVTNNVGHELSSCVGQDARKKSDAFRGDEVEGFGNAAGDEAHTADSGRQRGGNSRCGTSADTIAGSDGFCASVHNQNGRETGGGSDDVSTGHGSPNVENSDRSGRPFPQQPETTSVRQSQGSDFAWSRVDRIEIFQPHNSNRPGDGYVYNLEVDGLHTYVAGGAVVHNCHHVLRANKWGKGVGLFPNARGVGFTATLTRADRKALGSHKGGVFDDMVLGPEVRELIALGHLARFRMFGPRPSYTMSEADIGSGGDYSLEKLRRASHDSPITGDIVEHYLKITPGKLGITFVVDVETAVQTAAAFNSRGVPAAAVSAKTTDEARQSFLDQFQRGDIKQLVNVDLFGEGFDVPGVEVVSMGRKTMSLGLYRQQAGRMMRPAPGKTHGFLIDHVQNVIVHGPPDRVVAWSLDEPERKARVKGDDEIPVRTCTACHESYEVLGPTCPFCGHREEPASRSEPAFVDGDLFEYDEALMARLRGEIDNEGFCPVPRGASEMVAKGIQNRHDEKLAARGELRECIALWAGIQRDVFGRSDSESYRRFYFKFGIDVLQAQLLNRADTEKLTALIRSTFT